MRRTIMEAMKKVAVETLEGAEMELIDIEERQTVDKESGEITKFLSVAFLVPRGFDCFSRCAGSVKITDGKMKVKQEILDSADMLVSFKDLVISFIDGKGNVYFRASDYDVRKVGD